MTTARTRALAGAALALLLALRIPAATAQQAGNVADWYYAPIFGTGIYASGSRSVGVLQMQVSHELRRPSQAHWGLKLAVPVALGFFDYDLDSAVARDVPESVGTLSVVPRLEWQIPVDPRWTLRPYAAAGVGAEFAKGGKALILDFGARSRYLVSRSPALNVSLLNRLTLAGYRVSGGASDSLGFFATGLDFEVPTGLSLGAQALRFSVTPTHYFYFGALDFPQFNRPGRRLREELEIAFSVSTARPLDLPILPIDRLGIALRAGGGVAGIRIFTSLPF